MAGDKSELKKRLAEMRASLFAEGHLGERFTQLENQHEGSITKVEEAVNEFFEEVGKLLLKIDDKMEIIKGLHMADEIDELKQICKEIGAKYLKRQCKEAAKVIQERSAFRFLMVYSPLKLAIIELKEKLQAFFLLAKQAADED